MVLPKQGLQKEKQFKTCKISQKKNRDLSLKLPCSFCRCFLNTEESTNSLVVPMQRWHANALYITFEVILLSISESFEQQCRRPELK